MDRTALDEWNRATRVRDMAGLLQMIDSNKAFAVKDGTRVLVLEQDFNVTQVRVLEGPQATRAGWVNYEHVR